MDFEELGTILREERERRGLSIEVVMDATKISKTNILAMENGDRSGLPHPVYAKGFVKSYARYLGLDADELGMVVDREYQDHPQPERTHGYEVAPLAERAFQEHESGESRKRKSGLPLLILIVVLLCAAAAVFLILQNRKEPATASAPAVMEGPGAPEAAPAPVPEAGTPPQSEAQPEPSAPSAVPAASETAPTPPGGVAPAAGAAAAPSPEAASVSAVAPPSPPPVVEKAPVRDKNAEVATIGRQAEEAAESPEAVEQEKQKYDHIVIIRATTEKGCWVGLWKGDERRMARDFVLKDGEPLRLMFNSPRRIRIGNVAGVTVTYNGKPYPLDQDKGNIQTLTFGSD